MAGHNRYAERVRMAMKTANNPTGAPVSIRQLAELTGYSYEHCRKLVVGEPFGSREFNDVVCQQLGLPVDEMWQLAQQEKLVRRHGVSALAQLPRDGRLEAAWPHLTDTDRERVIQLAEALVVANTAINQLPARRVS